MPREEWERLLTAALEIGRRMMQSGAEARRVEDTITRICRAYGCDRCEVFAMVSLIIVSLTDTEGRCYTQTVRVPSMGVDLALLEDMNAEARLICAYRPSASEVERSLNASAPTKLSVKLGLLGYFLGAGGFALFYGASLSDLMCVGIISILVFLLDRYYYKDTLNQILYTSISCFLSGCIAILSVYLGIGDNVDYIVMGAIMLYIPGMGFANGIREMFHRDIITGLYRLIESVLIAASIAVGFAVSFALLGGLIR